MAKNKYDFIKELLEDKRLNQNQRERILELASKEISLEGSLEERVKKIEEIININIPEFKNLKTEIPSTTEDSSLPKYINPYHLYKFLFEYNQNPILRSTCHEIDSDELQKINEYCNSDNYDFSKHLTKIIEAFNIHEKKYFGGGKVNSLIRGYLTGKDYKGNDLKAGWTTDKIRTNWSSSELLFWAEQHTNIPPNLNESLAAEKEIELYSINPQLISSITKAPIQNFTQLVIHFKNLFHLKSGQQSLNGILKRINEKNGWHKKIDLTFDENRFSENLEHFTDVNRLILAYNKIMQLIIDQHRKDEKPRVRLKFYEQDKAAYFSIHHENTEYNKTVQNTVDRLGQTYSNLIDKQLNGLCNFILRADFGNGNFAEINLWDGEKIEAHMLNSFTGVEHILEFPKIKE